MRKLSSILMSLLFVGIISLEGCYSPPEFPNTPRITFKEVCFKQAEGADSLIISIDFQDGDGDLGLSEDEVTSPYNDKSYFSYIPDQNRLINFSLDTLTENEWVNILRPNLLNYNARRTPPFDTLPSFVKPYNCLNWEIIRDTENNSIIDTLYYRINPRHNNIKVSFFIDQPGGGFKEFDFKTDIPLNSFPNCGINFDGRFPLLQDTRSDRPLEGTIRYGMASVGFLNLFSIRRIKLRVKIFDRSLNVSNEIETPPFTLSEVSNQCID